MGQRRLRNRPLKLCASTALVCACLLLCINLPAPYSVYLPPLLCCLLALQLLIFLEYRNSRPTRKMVDELSLSGLASGTSELPEAERLQRQLQLFHLAADASASATIVLDQLGNVTLFNAAAESLFDLAERDLVGRKLPEMLSGLIPFIERGEETTGFCLSWGDGANTQTLSVDTKVWRDDEANIIGMLCSITDITGGQILKDSLSRSERLAVIGQMAAGTVHELRNPLAAARGFVQLLGKYKSRDESPHEYSELALLEIDRMDQILQEYLLLSKAVEPQLVALDIALLLQDTLELLEGVFAQKRIRLSTPVWQPLFVLGDVQYWQHVLQHLLFNAAEATPEQGRITISLHSSGTLATVTINDSGTGMDQQTLEHCFDPFYSTKEAGIGLGLTVCQRLVEEMGGLLAIDSTLGVGTTVNLSFLTAPEQPNTDCEKEQDSQR